MRITCTIFHFIAACAKSETIWEFCYGARKSKSCFANILAREEQKRRRWHRDKSSESSNSNHLVAALTGILTHRISTFRNVLFIYSKPFTRQELPQSQCLYARGLKLGQARRLRLNFDMLVSFFMPRLLLRAITYILLCLPSVSPIDKEATREKSDFVYFIQLISGLFRVRCTLM